MIYEVEQKYRVAGLAAFERLLRDLGADVEDRVEQVDSYFAHPSRDFAASDEAFRLRRVGDANFVTYKGPKIDTTTKTRREIEMALPAGAEFARQFTELLGALGFRLVDHVCKRRRRAVVQWQGGPVEAALDEVDRLGEFVELEIAAEPSDVEAARRRIASLARHLGLAEVERRSYLELLFEA